MYIHTVYHSRGKHQGRFLLSSLFNQLKAVLDLQNLYFKYVRRNAGSSPERRTTSRGRTAVPRLPPHASPRCPRRTKRRRCPTHREGSVERCPPGDELPYEDSNRPYIQHPITQFWSLFGSCGSRNGCSPPRATNASTFGEHLTVRGTVK